jgi:CSLREA domain-containing protein/uncharacterized repeat protein (TIGR01451 family)
MAKVRSLGPLSLGCAVAVLLSSLAAFPSMGATITVTGTGDTVAADGVCTLREAILSANANAAPNADCVAGTGTNDVISFNIPGVGLPKIINVTSALPTITEKVTIGGESQPGASVNTLAAGDNAVIGIELNGSGAGAATTGLTINTPEPTLATGNASVTITGLSFKNFGGPAIRMLNGGNSVFGCLIGVNGGNGGGTAEAAIVIHAGSVTQAVGSTIGLGSASTRNIISGNPKGGIEVSATSPGQINGCGIIGNYIGTNLNGTAVLANGGPGIFVRNAQATIGGNGSGSACDGECNVISGNQIGVSVIGGTNSADTSIFGNYIGVDRTGTVALGNGTGSNVTCDGSAGSTYQLLIGTANEQANVISGATRWGIEATSNVFVLLFGALIGTDRSGNVALPNALGGIRIVDATLSTQIIPAPFVDQPRVISGNGGPGIRFEGSVGGPFFVTGGVRGTVIGTKIGGATALANTGNGVEFIGNAARFLHAEIGDTADPAQQNVIAFNQGAGVAVTVGSHVRVNGFNSIFGNTGLGIDLGPTGSTPNDACDVDSGANDLQNFPVLTSASTNGVSSTTITGTLNSVASESFRIELFANPASPAQAKTFLGFTTVTTDGACNASFNTTLPVGVTPGSLITATATSNSASLHNTSEISAPVAAQGPLAVTKSFSAPSFPRGGTATLTITLANQSASTATSNAFTDTYPAGLINATPLTTTNGCAGTLTAAAGGNSVALTNGTIAASSTCTITILITSNAPGSYTNTIPAGAATSSIGANAVAATASVNVTGDPVPSKSFSPSTIAAGGTSTLTITLSNTASTPTTGVAFTDAYPSPVVNAATPGVTNSCGGAVTANAAGNSVALNGGTIPANGTCSITVVVTSATAGSFINSIAAGSVMSGNAGLNLTPTSATLTVLDPPTVSKSFAPTTINIGTTSQLTITLANPNPTALTSASFTDTYPAGLVNAASPNVTTTCIGGTATVPAANQVALSGATIPASSSCTVTVSVTSNTANSYTNTIPIGAVNAPPVSNGVAASATLTVVASSIGVAKTFTPNTIASGGTSQVQITLTNQDVIPLTGVAFSDSYPGGIVNTGASPSTTCGSGVVTATAGGSSLALAGGTIPASGTCTVTMTVTSSTPGVLTNTIPIGAISSAQGGSNTSAASATLRVLSAPGITKSFSPSAIASGAGATLTITLTNTNPATSITGVSFTDTYPAGVTNTTSPGALTSCGGGIATATANGTSVSLTGGQIAANGTCTVTVNVTSNTIGAHTNTISAGAVTSGNAGASTVAASATLTVLTPPTVAKQIAPSTIPVGGTATLTVTLTNTNAVPLTSVSFVDTYPTNVVNAATPNLANTCGGPATANAGGGSLSLGSGTIPANGTCTVSADITSTVANFYLNTIPAAGVSSNGGPNASPTSASLRVVTPPTVTKAFSPPSLSVGGTSHLTVTLSNSNPVALTSATFTDTYPTNLINAATSNVATTCGGAVTGSGGGTLVSLSGGTIPAASTCTVTVDVTSNSAGTYPNTIPVGGLTSSGGSNPATASASVTFTASPTSPTVTKAFSPVDTIAVGATTTLFVTLHNANATPITGVAFTDTYPSGVVNAATPNLSTTCGGVVSGAANGGQVSLSGGTIPASSTCIVRIDLTSGVPGVYGNTIPAGAVTSGQGSNGSPASAVLTVLGPPVAAKAFAPSTISRGAVSTITITLTNPNTNPLSDVAFVDTYPANVVNAAMPNATTTCGGTPTLTATAGGGSLTLGGSGAMIPASGSCTVSVDVTSSVPGSYNNSVFATFAVAGGGSGASNTASDTLTVLNGPGVIKSFSPSPIGIGGISNVTITLSNADSVALTGAAFTDTYPTNVVNAATPNAATTCAGGTVIATAAGGSVSLSGGTIPATSSCTVTVDVTSNTAGSYTNTIPIGAVTTTQGGTNAAAATATLSVSGAVVPPSVSKSFTPNTIASGSGASTLKITLSNPNSTVIAGVSLTDTYPAGLVNAAGASTNCGGVFTAIAGGGSLSLSGGSIGPNGTCIVSVPVTSSTPGALTNTIPAGGVTSSAGSNSVAASDTLEVLAAPSALKSFSPSTIVPGGVSTLTVALTNPNAFSLTGVNFADFFPGGLVVAASPNAVTGCGGTFTVTAGNGSFNFNSGTIPASSSCSVSVDVTSAAAGTYTNTINLVGSNGGPSASTTASLTVFAPLAVAKAFSPPTIALGSNSQLTITLTNSNVVPLTNVAFSDSYPAGLVNAATANASTTCGGSVTANAGTGTLSLSGGGVAASGSCTVSVNVTSAMGGSFINSLPAGAVTSSSPVMSSAGSATLNVLDIGVSKSFSGATIMPNGIARLMISLTNPTNTPISGVAFTDTYPAGLVNDNSPFPGNSCGGTVLASAGGGTISLNGGMIPANFNCTVAVNVASASSGSYVNTIAAGAVTGNGGSTNSASASATLAVRPGLAVRKAFSPNPILPGGSSTLVITISNASASAATGVAFSDTYPAGLVNAATPNASTTCGGTLTAAAGGGSVALTGGSVAASGGSCTVSVLVTSNTVGLYTNTIADGAISSSVGSSVGPATATLAVVTNVIGVTKSFSPLAIRVAQNTTLTITLSNTDVNPITGVSFTDSFTSLMMIASTPNVVNTCGGTVTASPGGVLITLGGGATIPANGTCSVSVDLTGILEGTVTNIIPAGGVSGNNGLALNAVDATARAVVGDGLIIGKGFNPGIIDSGATSQLTFNLFSTTGFDIHSVAFTDTYPTGVVNAAVPNATTNCGGTVTATPVGNTFTLSGATAPVSSLCQVSVMVTSSVLGSHVNTLLAGTATSSDGGSNHDGTEAALFVQSPPSILNVTKAFSPAVIPAGGVSRLTVTMGANQSSITSSDLHFDDLFPTGLIVTATPNIITTCGGTVTIGGGGASFSFSGGTVAAASTCSVGIDVTSATAGSYTNTIDAVDTTGGRANATPITATLTVVSGLGVTKSFAPSSMPRGGTSTLTITLFNSGASTANGLAFSDGYPSGLVNAAMPNASTACGGTVTASAGGGTVSLAGGSLAAGGSCTVTVNVTSAAAAAYTNTIAAGAVTAGAQSNTAGASAMLDVLAPLTVTKAFSPSSIGVNGTSQLTLLLNNPNAAPVHGIAFTDNYPAGVVNAATPNATSSCGGSVTAAAGVNSLALTGGTLPGSTGCFVSVLVTSSSVGGHTNTIASGAVSTSDAASNATSASDTLTVLAGISATKSFTPSIIAAGGTSQLTVTLTNATGSPAMNAAFVDSYPTQLSNASPQSVSSTCGGTVTAPAFSRTLQLSGGTIPAGGTCTVSVLVTANVSIPAINDLPVGAVTSSIGGNVAPASALLTILAPPRVLKSFSPQAIGQGSRSRLTITISNDNLILGPNAVYPLTALTFTDTYPAGLVNAAVPKVTSTCGGSATAAPGGNSLAFSGDVGQIVCRISVDVTSSTAGSYTNTLATGSVSTANAGSNIDPASDTLQVFPPVNVAKSFSPPAVPIGASSMLMISIANPNNFDVTDLDLDDIYPYPIVTAANPGVTSSCGGALGPASGGSALNLVDAVLPAGQTCTMTVFVTSPVRGTFTNIVPTSAVDAANSGAAAAASATLQVFVPPIMTKAFGALRILQGNTVSMTITLSSTDASPIPGVAFTDTYPAGLANAPTPNASTTCGGTVTAAPNGTSVALSGATIPANGTCKVTVTLAGVGGGVFTNTIPVGGLTVGGAGVNTTAAIDTITVVAPPGVAKAFNPTSVLPSETSTLTITLTNTNGQAITGAGFTDTYPAGLVNAPAPAAATTCAGGSVLATAGGGSLTFSGGTIPASGSCSVTVSVSSNTVSNYTNVIPANALTTNNTGPNAAAASGMLSVGLLPPPTLTKAFVPSTALPGQPTALTITLTNPSGSAITGVAFTDNYPFGLFNAVNPAPATTCGGTVGIVPGGTSLSFTGGLIPPNSSCTVTVMVAAPGIGVYTNTLPAASIATVNAMPNAAATGVLNVPNEAANGPLLSDIAMMLLIAALAGVAMLVMKMRGFGS